MRLSPDVYRDLVWGAAVLAGMVLAFFDRRLLRRWLLAWILAAVVAGGLLTTVISPFRFGGTSYYMEGVIAAGGSALALIGYGLGVVILALLFRKPSTHRRDRLAAQNLSRQPYGRSARRVKSPPAMPPASVMIVGAHACAQAFHMASYLTGAANQNANFAMR